MEDLSGLDIDTLREEAVTGLLEDSGPYLPHAVADKRLDVLRNAKVLAQRGIAEEVSKVTGINLPEDKVGGLVLVDGEDKLGRRALLERVDSPVLAYHTAVHEGIHLLGPDSVKGVDVLDRNYVRSSLGPKWTTFYLDDDGKIDDIELMEAGDKIFWEAATDFVAAQKSGERFGKEVADEELNKHGLGFVQRYWIEFLIENHPNSEEFLGTLKKALYTGEEIDFWKALGGRLENPHVAFYHTLAAYMREGEMALDEGRYEDYDAALDKWIAAIKYHFANGGAGSLNMEHYL